MVFTSFQKKILTTIYQYNPKGTDCVFKDLLNFIFNKNFKNVGILLKKDSPIGLSPEMEFTKFSILKQQLQELFFLLEYLNKNNLLIYIKITDKPLQENFTYGEFLEKENRKINLDTVIINKIFENLFSDFYISSSLKDLIKKKFKTTEDKNLDRTLWALWISIGVAFLQMILSLYIAKTIPVSVEFKDPQKIAIIKNNDVFSKRSNYNGFFNKN